eukprot:comp12500_c0_seq1/m.7457 comp12500_c0_seq1/g.7457  ORF comp12500_c0_seq1/g.7457 comp12500_c0_seq1/m.7457 type:complete len:626 (-) comp12500_c0_seq1:152-2029(-)
MERKPLKVLVTGDVKGQFGSLYSRVRSIQKKVGPFDLLLCAGSFFSEDERAPEDEWNNILSGDNPVPIPTYVLGGTRRHHAKFFAAIPNGGDLAPNIHYLGRRGIFKTAEGLTIAYLSGIYDASTINAIVADDLRPSYTRQDVDQAVGLANTATFKGVDILLTTEWSKGVTRLTSQQVPARNPEAPPLPAMVENMGSEYVAAVAKAFMPRYHFAGQEGVFFERAPYRNHTVLQGRRHHVTRFIGMADIPTPTKMKAVYAFNILPLAFTPDSELSVQPPGTTECPLVLPQAAVARNAGPESTMDESFSFFYGQQGPKRGGRQGGGGGGRKGTPGAGYVCRICNVSGHYIEDCPSAPPPSGHKRKQSMEPPPPGYVCRQCQVVGHWISDCPQLVHDEMKRRKTEQRAKAESSPDCWFCLSSPQVEKHLVVTVGTEMYLALAKGPLVDEHVLLLPINHVPSSRDLGPSALAELERFKKALVSYFASQGRTCVFFERNMASRHLQIQVVPLPKAFPSDLIKQVFAQQAERLKATFQEATEEVLENLDSSTAYFLVECADGSQTIHVRESEGGPRFPLQFGREVLGSALLLDCPQRVDWRECKQSQEEEAALAKNMRAKFSAFDPSNEDD